jgi:hypothetical protein
MLPLLTLLGTPSISSLMPLIALAVEGAEGRLAGFGAEAGR